MSNVSIKFVYIYEFYNTCHNIKIFIDMCHELMIILIRDFKNQGLYNKKTYLWVYNKLEPDTNIETNYKIGWIFLSRDRESMVQITIS